MGEDSDKSRGSDLWPYFTAAQRRATGGWAQRRRIAAALRAAVQGVIDLDTGRDDLEALAKQAEALARELAARSRPHAPGDYAEAAVAGDVEASFDNSPLIGLSNPLSPPLVLHHDDGVVTGRVVFGDAYEGPPGHVHGGFIAAAFDELLGFTQSLTGKPGMTGTLTVRYRAPTPLAVELCFEARVVGVERRKILTSGILRAGDTITAEAEGIFVSVDPARFAELVASARRGDAGSTGPPRGGDREQKQ